MEFIRKQIMEEADEEKKSITLTALLLVCVFGISACKKNVGTPEDNPQVKEETDEEEQEKYTFGLAELRWRIHILLRLSRQFVRRLKRMDIH